MDGWWRRRQTSRRDEPPRRAPYAPPHPSLAIWLAAVDEARARARGPLGRVALSMLGDPWLRDRGTGATERVASPWLGYAPDEAGWADLMERIGESRELGAGVIAVEAPFRQHPPVAVPDDVHAVFLARTAADLDEARATDHGLVRSPDHLRAEEVWRATAARISPGRAHQLHVERALGQVRWFPGIDVRTHVAYSDPLDLANVSRSVMEVPGSDDEWQATKEAYAVFDWGVDPLEWRVSSLARVIEVGNGWREEI